MHSYLIYGHAPLRYEKSLVLDFPHNGEYTLEVLSAGLVWEMIGRIFRDIGVEWDGPDRNWNGCTGRFYIVVGFHGKVLRKFSNDSIEFKNAS